VDRRRKSSGAKIIGEESNDKDKAKIWCADRENFQYIKACKVHCRKKSICQAFRDYFEPKLF
jgi:hypothetical protein